MTPLQMANAECPNWNQGACAGARIADNLSPLPGRPLDKCALANEKRCDYFEECVLPMAAMASGPDRSKSFMAAANSYRILHKMAGVIRRCPECAKSLPARRRVCADCAAKRRRNSNREAQRRNRDVAVSSQGVFMPFPINVYRGVKIELSESIPTHRSPQIDA